MIRQAQWWLNTARNDLKAAHLLLDSGDCANASFHAQQAAEKLLKAVAVSRGSEARTHSCTELLSLFKAKLGLSVSPEIETAARKLDLHYIQSRYPNGLGGDPSFFYNAGIASESIQCARTIFERFESEMN